METPIKKNNVLGKRIKQLRSEKNMTQTDLAKKVGVTRSAVANWENGDRTPDYKTAGMIARMFGVPLDYLYGKSEHRYKINVPDYFELDLSKLNGKGMNMLYENYKLLLNSEEYTA